MNGVVAKGETRHIQKVNVKGEEAYVLARNDDSAMVIKFNDEPPSVVKK